MYIILQIDCDVLYLSLLCITHKGIAHCLSLVYIDKSGDDASHKYTKLRRMDAILIMI